MSTLEERVKKTAYMREWVKRNPSKVKANKKKTYWKNKALDNARSKVWRDSHKEYKAQKDKEYRDAHKEELSLKHKEYYIKNKEKITKKIYARDRYRRQTDPLYNLKAVLRTQILINLVGRKYKKSKTTEDLLGARIEIVKAHIESQFKDGMTWDNHGEWHIDHIIPLSSAKNRSEIYKLFHYKNLQPLWANENLSKGCKFVV